MSLNKLKVQKAELRKQERQALHAVVELETKVRMAERFIHMIPYTSKKKTEREDQLAELQLSLKEQNILLELIEDTRKELGIVEEDEPFEDEKKPVLASEVVDETKELEV